MISAAFYALLVIVPLILTPWNYELFEFNKMLAVYAGALIIAAGWLIEMVRQKRLIFVKTPLDLPLLLFLISQILATIFSIDRHTSVWGYYSRFHGGLLSTVSYLILYWAYSTFMRDKTKKVIGVILSAGLVVSLYALAERLGIDKHVWQQLVQERVFSTLGQPNWLAAYLLLLLPLSLARSLKKRRYWLLTAVYLAALWFTRSRSGLLGLALAGLVFGLMRWRKLTLILAALGLVGLAFTYRYLPKETGLAETAPAISQGGSSSSDIRQAVWKGAVDIWKHYPLFGSGAETFAYSYYNFRPVEHNLLSEWDFLYNKAHNEFLNFLATSGAFGLGSYLFLIIWTSVWLLRTPHVELRTALLAAYLGVSVTNFFGFAVVPVALLFFLFPALALPSQKTKPVYHSLNNFQAAAITAICLLTFYGLLFITRLWRADYLFNRGRQQVKAKLLTEGFQNLSRAVKLSPREPLFRNDLAEAEAQLAYAYSSPSAELSQKFFDQAVRDADLVIAQNPVNLNFWRSRIKIFLTLAELDPAYSNRALQAFDRAISLAPTDPKLTYNLGLIYNQLGQTGLAEQLLVKTLALKANYEAARVSLGSLYEQTGREDLARKEYEFVLKNLNPDNSVVKDRLERL